MQSYEYRVIPAPRRAKRAKGARTNADRFARTLTDVINGEAGDGWEYVRADTLPLDEKKGMLSGATEVYHSVLVFRRALPQAAMPAAAMPVEPAPRPARQMHEEPDPEPANEPERAPEPRAPYALGPASRTDD